MEVAYLLLGFGRVYIATDDGVIAIEYESVEELHITQGAPHDSPMVAVQDFMFKLREGSTVFHQERDAPRQRRG